ncbi:MAG: exodeoxyribonuclease V subunit gamma [Rubrivivax sp.]|nr:exodeoxyribonuclease V subunit gamma [Rubrivivax sp.]
MLHFHFANRYETLTAGWLDQISLAPPGVFASIPVLVPSAAIQRSLTLAAADRLGLCADLRFDFLAQWLWQQIGRIVPGVGAESPFTPALLSWRLHAALGDAAFVASQPRLARYLAGADEVMRHDLAGRVAALFDQYTTYRPDWLLAWREGRPAEPVAAQAHADEAWQAALWQRLAAELGIDALHPANAFVRALKDLDARSVASAGLPAVAHVFALPTMPPLHRQLLQQLGNHIELHVHALNPCREFWFDAVSPKRLSHLALRGLAASQEVGNRLLSAWGGQTQAHIDGLVDVNGAIDDGHYQPHPGSSLLARLHNAILDMAELAPGTAPLADGDRSIELHVCHSLTRELEVLQDHLLGLFASAGGRLRPADILVLTPDLEAAAPLIDAVFGTAARERHIPYTVSGRPRSRVNAAARAWLALLTLGASRCGASALHGLLQQPIVARRFGLDEDDLERLHGWLLDSRMRWGLDAAHRASFDVPAQASHTLADSLDRLLLGYALPAQTDQTFDGRLPAGAAEGSAALALGAFWRFAGTLQALQRALASAHTPAAWAALLRNSVADFLDPQGDEIDDQRELLAAITALAEQWRRADFTQPLPLAVVRAALEQVLDDPARGGVAGGNVTFASMSSLRNLPSAVVCVIGLDDGRFPSAQRPLEFDLLAWRPRRGDRQRRSDERNLFLDLLLAARHSLYLSHSGRSVRDNSALPPSVLVAELLDVLVPAVADDPQSPASLAQARRRLVVEHPLQPFAVEGFAVDGDPRLRSFNRELGVALQRSLAGPALAAPLADSADDDAESGAEAGADDDDDSAVGAALPVFFAQPLAPPGPEWRSVTLAQLVAFFRNPCRTLLRQRLGVAVSHDADRLEDVEPMLPDWPGVDALTRRLLPALLQGAGEAQARQLAAAGNELPAGALGMAAWEHTWGRLGPFAAQVRDASAAPCLAPLTARVAFDLDGQAWQLEAGFADLRPAGLLRWRCDKLRAGDRIEAWLHHLLLCAAAPAGVDLRTTWLSLDAPLQLMAPADPKALLADLLRLYRQGLSEPLHFFPKAAWAYVENDASLNAARKVWQVTPRQPHGEAADPAYRLALRGRGEALDERFTQLAEAVFAPLLAHQVNEDESP